MEISSTPTPVLPMNDQSDQGVLLAVVADDDDDVRSVIVASLKRDGFTVVEASNGKAALELIEQHQPDVAVLDLVMPEMYGIAVLRKVRDNPDLKHMPVVILTAQVADEDAVRGFEAGASDYIRKPFSPKELVARVRSLIAAS